MDHSPPKRMTRARAAVRSSDKTTKISRVATSTSKAGNTSTKRKTRSDEVQSDDCQGAMEKAPAPGISTSRARAQKTSGSKMENPSALSTKKPTRGRPRKLPPNPAVPEQTRSIRDRNKRTDIAEDKKKTEEENVVKRTRRRPISTMKSIDSTKPANIEELDKENIIPDSKKNKGIVRKQTEQGTGFRAKPVRKPPSTRSTRGRKAIDKQVINPIPLSPKKHTQLATSKDILDEPLATTDATEIEPLKKSPLKASGIVFSTTINEASSLTTTLKSDNSKNLEPIDSISSPARRRPHKSFKDGMKSVPVKIHNSASILLAPPRLSIASSNHNDTSASVQTASLQSPARRPRSPTKILIIESPSKSEKIDTTYSPSKSSNQNTYIHSSLYVSISDTSKVDQGVALDSEIKTPKCPHSMEINVDNELDEGSNSRFPGRLSSIMPRELDPAISSILSPHEVTLESHHELELISNHVGEDYITGRVNCNNNPSLSQNSSDPFLFRTTNVNISKDSDPDEKFSDPFSQYSANKDNPTFTSSTEPLTTQTPKFLASYESKQYEMNGFTPLAQKLSHWMVENPEKSEVVNYPLQISPTVSDLSSKQDDGMTSLQSIAFDDKIMTLEENASALSMALDLLEDNFEPVKTDQEDLELAMEANELSLIGPSVIDILGQEVFESEQTTFQVANFKASSEESPVRGTKAKHYLRSMDKMNNNSGKNHTLIDPQLLTLTAQQNVPLTPKRTFTKKICHTVCKVPLKPAADNTPMRPSLSKGSASFSRPPIHHTSFHSNKVSFPMTDGKTRSCRKKAAQAILVPNDMMTPLKQHAEWSTLVTPARTARPDLNPCLLKGASILVDVYTSEGVDSSAIFMEILTQMGARCVKSWTCKKDTDEEEPELTHVVFKDGRKSILDKVRESEGRVACVGLGWVLDCERDNDWLDEGPYLVNLDFTPRSEVFGRTESFALENTNNRFVPISTPSHRYRPKNEFSNFVSTSKETSTRSKSRRRDSGEWVRPSIPTDVQDLSLLPPLPTTPCPEEFFESEWDQSCNETPSQTPYFLHKECLMQKTAPVKRQITPEPSGTHTGRNGDNSLEFLQKEDNNQGIMMRLMAAKRKSLQWAPKCFNVFNVFDDATWRTEDNRKSFQGYAVLYNGAVISWISQRQRSTALNSIEAEIIAANKEAKEAAWMEKLWKDFHQEKPCGAITKQQQTSTGTQGGSMIRPNISTFVTSTSEINDYYDCDEQAQNRQN